MFRNYLKTAVRNLLRYKGFAFVNIASLTIGLVGCLSIGLFVWDEMKYDRGIAGGDTVYRIYNERYNDEGTVRHAPVPPAYTSFLKQQYPEVDTTFRILMSNDQFLVEVGEKRANEAGGIFADPGMFAVLPLSLRQGDPATALTAPSSIVLTRELAEKYFGSVNPVGKTVKIDKSDFLVTGVLATLPTHFHLHFNYIMSLSSAGIPEERMQKWTWSQFYSYVKLKPGASARSLQDKLQAHVRKEIYPTLKDGSTFLPFFQPLRDIHLNSADFVYDNAVRGNATYVKGLTIIALFVLLIACFNFINLATARSFRRAREIGVRKVIGADRKQIVVQFIAETALLALFAAVLAIGLCFGVLPSLNAFTGKAIPFQVLASPLFLLLVLAGSAFIGVLAGIYPAFVLSGFQPIKVLKSAKATGTGGTGWLRQALVVVQFSLSALLIISSTIVYRQIRFLNDRNLGFDKAQVLTFPVKGDVATKTETFKAELRRAPGVLSVTSGYGLPGDMFATDNVTVPGANGDKEYSSTLFLGDYDYLKTIGLRLVAGRDFSRDLPTDTSEAFIINETAVKEFGFGSPEKALGQRLNWHKWTQDTVNAIKKGRVIGVVQDFHYKSLHEKVAASVIHIYPQELYKVAVKLRSSETKKTIAYVGGLWNRFAPGYPLEYSFLDESYGKMYQSEEKLGSLLWVFTLMAVIVGCMGLFALAAFSAEQRTKEIGIRKVLGASVLTIMGLMSRSFVKLVLIAALVAFPIAWWAMHNWLSDFPYRVAISWWIFAVATLAAVMVAFLTVSFQAVKVATANPVKSLRTE
ncbi:MAG: FtsX-like permease family protein [Flaviaesturariibacter sp.]|nr:FtsX-like permease family protein [Flaviaesturariibacter sp.]